MNDNGETVPSVFQARCLMQAGRAGLRVLDESE